MRLQSLVGVSMFALCATGAYAQTPSATPEPKPATAAADQAGGGEEIIVTASKRARTLQDTPISVAVTTAAAIERSNIRDVFDLATLVPSLRVGQLQSSANTNFFIRGFGNGANNAGIEPSVGVFIDGVYRSRSAAQIGDLPNVQRVEVLRGPQSTLFGKNASAGIISVVTTPPDGKTRTNLEASYGNYSAIVLKGAVSGPVSETLGLGISANYNKRDGYARYVNLGSEVNDRNRYGVRGEAYWKPTDNANFRFIADFDRIDEVCCTVANVVNGPTGAAIRGLGGNINFANPFSYDGFANFPSTNKVDNSGISAQADIDLGENFSLTSITAQRWVTSESDQDSDFTSADLIGSNPNKTEIDTFTQEVRLASNFGGMADFMVGAYYFKESIDINSSLTFGRDFRGYANLLSGGAYSSLEPTLRALYPATRPGQFGAQGQGRFERYDYSNDALSLFGQIDVRPTEKLTLTGGFNFTQDNKKLATNTVVTDSFSSVDLIQAAANAGIPGPARTIACAPGAPAGTCNPFLGLRGLQFIPQFLNLPNAVEDGKKSDDKLTYTLRASYKFNRNLNGYVSYATGFKASSFNLSTDSRPFPSTFVPGSPAQVPAPAASAIRTAGLALPNLTSGTRFAEPENSKVTEVGLKGNFDKFGFNLAIFDQVIEDFQSNVFVGTGFVLGNAPKQSVRGFELDMNASPTENLNLTASITRLDAKFDSFPGGTAFNPATNNTGPADLTGKTPSGIPPWSWSVGATYTIPLDAKRVILHTDYRHDSSYVLAQGLSTEISPESLNGSIALQLDSGLEFSVWGRNLTEKEYNTTLFPSVAQAGSISGYPSGPAFYGVTVRYKN